MLLPQLVEHRRCERIAAKDNAGKPWVTEIEIFDQSGNSVHRHRLFPERMRKAAIAAIPERSLLRALNCRFMGLNS